MRRLALACLLLAVVGCDRVPIGSDGDISPVLISPDLSEVQTSPDLQIRFVPESASLRLGLQVEDVEVPYDTTLQAFVYDARLIRGLNAIPYTLFGDDGPLRRDTLYAVYLPLTQGVISTTTGLPARTSAASAPLGTTGQGLVSGGFGVSRAPLASATILQLVSTQILAFEIDLERARGGHTATELLDGVLLMGGASTEAPSAPSDFVRPPEWIGPNGEARTVQVDGGEPARSGHVARAVLLDGTTYVYLLGGRTPGAAASSTVDVYRVDGDRGFGFTLTRLSPEGGASGFAALAGPALAPIGDRSAVAVGLDGAEGATLDLRWSTPGTGTFPFSLSVRPGEPLATPRTDAEAVDLGGGLALVTGGRTAGGEPLGSVEVYAPGIDRVFSVPGIQLRVPRSEHTATIFGGGRIVIGGGRPSAGSAIASFEVLQF
ncbi:hypothetical protein [Rubrivirga marina]|uniref:SbsA Ig-like domain-containing protein n=1 Tax=Rubrivirga marina TaxID=1196024 RepID=A0A271IYL7_9BACT|nr:hypothetical protein [Rubrivirga marina]PAP76177.1 hypothetical protein BSZ37_06810 [Rubrivirga marina]